MRFLIIIWLAAAAAICVVVLGDDVTTIRSNDDVDDDDAAIRFATTTTTSDESTIIMTPIETATAVPDNDDDDGSQQHLSTSLLWQSQEQEQQQTESPPSLLRLYPTPIRVDHHEDCMDGSDATCRTSIATLTNDLPTRQVERNHDDFQHPTTFDKVNDDEVTTAPEQEKRGLVVVVEEEDYNHDDAREVVQVEQDERNHQEYIEEHVESSNIHEDDDDDNVGKIITMDSIREDHHESRTNEEEASRQSTKPQTMNDDDDDESHVFQDGSIIAMADGDTLSLPNDVILSRHQVTQSFDDDDEVLSSPSSSSMNGDLGDNLMQSFDVRQSWDTSSLEPFIDSRTDEMSSEGHASTSARVGSEISLHKLEGDEGESVPPFVTKNEEQETTSEKPLNVVESRVEELLFESDELRRQGDNLLEREKLHELLTQRDNDISLHNKDRAATCEKALTSLEIKYETTVSEHIKDHAAMQKHLIELQRQLESQQQASIQKDQHLVDCEKHASETRDYYDNIVIELERNHSVAVSSLVQLQQQEMVLLQKLSDADQRAFTLVEERAMACEKSLTTTEKHFEQIIAEYEVRQSVAQSSLQELQEQVTELKEANSILRENDAMRDEQYAATCEKSLLSKDLHYQTLITEYENNQVVANSRILELEQQLLEQQNQIAQMEAQSSKALHVARHQWEEDQALLMIQAEKNISTVESHWQHHIRNIRNENIHLQENVKNQNEQLERLIDQLYAARREMFATYRNLHDLQSKANSRRRYFQISMAGLVQWWAHVRDRVVSSTNTLRTLVVVSTDRFAKLHHKINDELEQRGISAVLKRFETQIVTSVSQQLQTIAKLLPTKPLLPFRSWPILALSQCLRVRQQMHEKVAHAIRVTTHVALAYCHVTNIGRYQPCSFITTMALSWLKWSHEHCHVVVQRTELMFWLLLVGYIILRRKRFRIFLWMTSRNARRRTESKAPGNVVAPAKIKPAFRYQQSVPIRRPVTAPS